MQSEASFKMICLGVGTTITGHASPGVQLPSTFLLMSSTIHLQSHPSWPRSPIPHHPFTKEAMTPHYQFNKRNTKLKLPAGVKGPKAEGEAKCKKSHPTETHIGEVWLFKSRELIKGTHSKKTVSSQGQYSFCPLTQQNEHLARRGTFGVTDWFL